MRGLWCYVWGLIQDQSVRQVEYQREVLTEGVNLWGYDRREPIQALSEGLVLDM